MKSKMLDITIRIYLDKDVSSMEIENIVSDLAYNINHPRIVGTDLYHYEKIEEEL